MGIFVGYICRVYLWDIFVLGLKVINDFYAVLSKKSMSAGRGTNKSSIKHGGLATAQ